MRKAIILCSGGLDSVTTAFHVKKDLKYENLIILFFDYGQRNLKQEKAAASHCASMLKGKLIEINLKSLGQMSSSMLNTNEKPKALSRKDLKDSKKESDKWYVPCRNLVFISNALALAESIYIKEKIKPDIFVGFKDEGKEAFPDQTKEFVSSLNKVSAISTKGKFSINAPLIKKDKEDIINLGIKLDIDYSNTWSCYVGEEKQCGTCLACKLRQEGFRWANVKDPTDYKTN